MAERESLDEIDLALLNALQINGRASWSLIGNVLGISAGTVARRWERLAATGIAWVTAYGGPSMWEYSCLAFVEIDCTVGRSDHIAQSLASDTFAASVEFTAGGGNLLLTVVISSLPSLERYIQERVSALEGIIGIRVHLATRVYTDASKWRLGALSPAKQSQLTPHAPQVEGIVRLRPEDRPLLVALGVDGRRPYTDLAEELGVSVSTIRRQLQRMIEWDVIRLRCDVANTYTSSPVLVSYQGVCDPTEIDFVGTSLSKVPEVRVCAASLGANNLLFTVWLNSAASSLVLEEQLSRALPQLKIVKREITLRTIKRFGRILDSRGRSVAAVPMDMWSEEFRPIATR